MNQRREVNGARILVWAILVFFVAAMNAKPQGDVVSTVPTDAASSSIDTISFDRTIVSVPGVDAVVPQVGYLEETEKDITVPIVVADSTDSTDAEKSGINDENSAHGILVPVVSVVDSSKNNPNGNPLVALLPVSVPVTTPADESIAQYDQAQSIEPQVNRREANPHRSTSAAN